MKFGKTALSSRSVERLSHYPKTTEVPPRELRTRWESQAILLKVPDEPLQNSSPPVGTIRRDLRTLIRLMLAGVGRWVTAGNHTGGPTP